MKISSTSTHGFLGALKVEHGTESLMLGILVEITFTGLIYMCMYVDIRLYYEIMSFIEENTHRSLAP